MPGRVQSMLPAAMTFVCIARVHCQAQLLKECLSACMLCYMKKFRLEESVLQFDSA